MYSYIVRFNEQEYPLQLSMDEIQGIYAAQILANISSYLTGTPRDLFLIGLLQHPGQFLFSIRTSDAAEDIPQLLPEQYPDAYNIPLPDLRVWNTVTLAEYDIEWDTKQLPYPLRQNYDAPLSTYIMRDDETNPFFESTATDMFTQNPSKVESARYYIGFSGDGRNTLLVPITHDVHNFIRGMYIFYRFVVDSQRIEKSKRQQYSESVQLPVLYLYDYGSDVTIDMETTNQSVVGKLPVSISQITLQ